MSVLRLIEIAEEVFEFPMCDRDPTEQRSFGRMTLLGDAAHPMCPIGGNGVSKAILDAESFVLYLASEGNDVVKALKMYDETRRPPDSAIVYANRGKVNEILPTEREAFCCRLEIFNKPCMLHLPKIINDRFLD